MHDDLQMMRQLEMEKCFLDFQIPCRWVPDMGYGFGYPLFNFYPPLPYLVGQLIRVIGYSFADTAKALFIIAIMSSGVTMYYLAKQFFGRLGGVLSSVFYIWAPYHAVDVYVRGAMNESWGLIWFPVILLFSYKIIVNKYNKFKSFKQFISELPKPAIIGLALSWFALFTSHNLMVVVFTPFFAVWCAVWILKTRNWTSAVPLLFSGIWSFALAAFFTLPVFLEKDIVQTNTLVKGYFEFTAHFPSFGQLFFSRFWGYGPSVWLDIDDKMSFQIGWLHWTIPVIIMLLLAYRTIKHKKIDTTFLSISTLFFAALLASFMAHPRSTPIWQAFSPLQFIQFPWRYLTIVIFGFSFVVGGITRFFPRVVNIFIVSSLSLLAVIYSWTYFVPEYGKLGPLTDEQKFTAAAWDLQQTAGIYDYLPNTAKTAPKAPRTVQAEIMEGEGEVIEGDHGTNWERFTVRAETETTVRVSVFQFPNWNVTIDGQKVDTFVPDTEEWGRLYVKVPAGEHAVYAKLEDTAPRTAGNIISLISWILLFVVIFTMKYAPSKK